jgi:DNA-binding transcriptional ArsR family regulator
MPFKLKIHFILCVVILCVLAGVCGPVSAFDLSYSNPTIDDDLVITPADYEIVPIDDGIEGVTITGWLNLVYWKEVLPIYIGSYFDYFEPTPLGNMTSTILVPLLTTIFGVCGTFIFFCRRKSPEKNPKSIPAKILTYIRQHKFCSQKQIVDGVESSRGSVAYQLHRLQNEQKIFAAEVNGRTYYSAHPIDQESLEPIIYGILENETIGSIFKTLYLHPNLTRHEIAGIIGKSPDTVYFHLKKFDGRLLTEVKEGGNSYYSLSPDANDTYFRMERGEVTGSRGVQIET